MKEINDTLSERIAPWHTFKRWDVNTANTTDLEGRYTSNSMTKKSRSRRVRIQKRKKGTLRLQTVSGRIADFMVAIQPKRFDYTSLRIRLYFKILPPASIRQLDSTQSSPYSKRYGLVLLPQKTFATTVSFGDGTDYTSLADQC